MGITDKREDVDTTIQPNGQQKDYLVLSEAELAKGFVRPVRTRYIHVGIRPKYPLRDLTEEQEAARVEGHGYVKYERYPDSESPVSGRYWTQAQLDSGCGTSTTISSVIAGTYARDPEFYGATFCFGCKAHFPVGAKGEFTWDDGSKVGT
ncbi:hypothetical protein LCGC14_2793970 [marine sediment metagenome]|uniref:Uncharacterized protein n=1 Tax=marine sediment metagenome TaxID=412755 RepID=A0A0F9AYE7_9ZZZZ